MIIARDDQLQGWKEIAAYLNRDERTVKRWEKQRGLPVRRIPGGGRANVYCLVSELDAWFSPDVALDLESGEDAGEETTGGVLSALMLAEGESEATDWAYARIPRPNVVGEPHEDGAGTLLGPSKRANSRPGALLTVSVAVFGITIAIVLLHGRGHAAAMKTTVTPSGVADSRLEALPGRERYLQGVYFYEKRTPADLEKARSAFEECIAHDPRDAAAYAGLANTFLLLREYSTMPAEEGYRRGQEAAERALALDANLADAHAALGFIFFFDRWRPEEAEREFQTALRLEPGSALAHHWYGSMLLHEARFPEAVEQLSVAQRIQPTSAAILATKAYALGLSGHRNDAMDTLQMLGTQTGDMASLHRTMAALSLIEPRNTARFLDERRRFAEIRRDRQEMADLAAAAMAYRRTGEEAMWRVLLARERGRQPASATATYEMARLEAALGENDRAVRDLLVLADAREPAMIGVEVDTLLGPLRQTEEFGQVRAALHLPHGSPAPVTRDTRAALDPPP